MKLRGRGSVFFELLAEAAGNVAGAAEACALLYDRYPDADALVEQVRWADSEAERLAAGLLRRIDATFVTPVPREDLVALGMALDHVCGLIEDAALLPALLHVEAVPEHARAQSRALAAACRRLADAVERLAGFPDLSAEVGDVYALEDEGDDLLREALARLFAGGGDPLTVIRLKGIHDALEEAIDGAAAAARVVESMGLRNR